jgi:integrase
MAEQIKKVVLRDGKVRYRFVVDVGRDAQTGRRKQLTVTKDTQKDARTELARIQHQRGTGTYIAPSKMTLGEWLDEWLERKARDVEATTIRTYKLALVHAHERIGHIRLQALTEDDIEAFIDWLLVSGRRRGGEAGTGLRVSYVEGILTRINEALGRAVVRKMVAANVAQYVKVPKQAKKQDRRDHRQAKPWNVAEVQTFIRGIEADRLHAPLLLSLMGLRPAEVCGMRWLDIDLTAGILETANTRTMLGNGTVLEKDTKTEAGERVLPLPSTVAQPLGRFRAQQARERLAAGEAYTDTGYVVVDELGLPRNTRQLREHAYKLMRDLGLRKVRLYDARHSCLTYLAVNGVSDVVLAAWAGHTSASFTKKKYVHVEAEDMRPAAATWDRFHGGLTASPTAGS